MQDYRLVSGEEIMPEARHLKVTVTIVSEDETA